MAKSVRSAAENYGKQNFMRYTAVAEALGVTGTTLYRHLTPYLHRLEFPSTGNSRYSTSYIASLGERKAPDREKRVYVSTKLAALFATTETARILITTAEQTYEDALVTRLDELPTGQRALRTGAIVDLLGVPQSTVSSWVERQVLEPLTKHGEPHPLTGRGPFFFPEEQFRSFTRWSVPNTYQHIPPPPPTHISS